MRVSVIVSTYNRPLALDRVLQGLAEQHVPAAEVLVADDGSKAETRHLVESWKPAFPVPLLHVWHEDRGFRLAEIRNRAALAARGDWLQFIDGDCVPRPHFVQRIERLAARGWALAGDRILLSESLTRRVEAAALPIHRWGLAKWAIERARRGINRLAPLVYWPLRVGRGLGSGNWRRLRGANIGVAREDFEKVNGFEQAFTGWGLEDSEFAIRLLNSGVRIRNGRLAVGLLHLWHPEQARDRVPAHQDLLEQARISRRTRAGCGLTELAR
jgi:glycosyltransferase involved in cell wall biosynthesis